MHVTPMLASGLGMSIGVVDVGSSSERRAMTLATVRVGAVRPSARGVGLRRRSGGVEGRGRGVSVVAPRNGGEPVDGGLRAPAAARVRRLSSGR